MKLIFIWDQKKTHICQVKINGRTSSDLITEVNHAQARLVLRSETASSAALFVAMQGPAYSLLIGPDFSGVSSVWRRLQTCNRPRLHTFILLVEKGAVKLCLWFFGSCLTHLKQKNCKYQILLGSFLAIIISETNLYRWLKECKVAKSISMEAPVLIWSLRLTMVRLG